MAKVVISIACLPGDSHNEALQRVATEALKDERRLRVDVGDFAVEMRVDQVQVTHYVSPDTLSVVTVEGELV